MLMRAIFNLEKLEKLFESLGASLIVKYVRLEQSRDISFSLPSCHHSKVETILCHDLWNQTTFDFAH